MENKMQNLDAGQSMQMELDVDNAEMIKPDMRKDLAVDEKMI